MDTNPYIPSRVEHKIALRRWTGSILATSVLLYPLIALTLLYVTWGFATLELGRPPIPYREYPDGVIIMALSWMTAILHLLAPIAVPVGLTVSILYPFAQTDTRSTSAFARIASLATYIAIAAAVYMVISRDPYRVVDWCWD